MASKKRPLELADAALEAPEPEERPETAEAGPTEAPEPVLETYRRGIHMPTEDKPKPPVFVRGEKYWDVACGRWFTVDERGRRHWEECPKDYEYGVDGSLIPKNAAAVAAEDEE